MVYGICRRKCSVSEQYTRVLKISTDLTRPERDEGTKGIAGFNLGLTHLGEGGTECSGESTSRGSLDLDLGHLKRAEGDISEDLSRGRTGEPDKGLVIGGQFLASSVHIQILEDFVETILEHALERVPDQGWSETFPEATGALLSGEEAKARTETLVFYGVHLWNAGGETMRYLGIAVG